jgi:hypothetical protein
MGTFLLHFKHCRDSFWTACCCMKRSKMLLRVQLLLRWLCTYVEERALQVLKKQQKQVPPSSHRLLRRPPCFVRPVEMAPVTMQTPIFTLFKLQRLGWQPTLKPSLAPPSATTVKTTRSHGGMWRSMSSLRPLPLRQPPYVLLFTCVSVTRPCSPSLHDEQFRSNYVCWKKCPQMLRCDSF